jgi:DNA-binding transcriptional LysR family regulator
MQSLAGRRLAMAALSAASASLASTRRPSAGFVRSLSGIASNMISLGLATGSALQETLNHHAARAGLRLKLRVRLDGFASMARMVENGIGVAVLPETTARRCEQSMGHPRCSPNGQLGASPLFCLCSRSQVAANTRSMARSALVRSPAGARARAMP